ncbi:hypothetical protein BB934_45630 (plasmid) [Microvirga ossetica]|uniref:Uncharacterized protein n=2 Tax=Microvirga ossetica TaxID=1882682 RepID=A0A1B2F031_9HYPH|nr:hypothetical protein BB934_45630 [Microvirga ossetica]
MLYLDLKNLKEKPQYGLYKEFMDGELKKLNLSIDFENTYSCGSSSNPTFTLLLVRKEGSLDGDLDELWGQTEPLLHIKWRDYQRHVAAKQEEQQKVASAIASMTRSVLNGSRKGYGILVTGQKGAFCVSASDPSTGTEYGKRVLKGLGWEGEPLDPRGSLEDAFVDLKSGRCAAYIGPSRDLATLGGALEREQRVVMITDRWVSDEDATRIKVAIAREEQERASLKSKVAEWARSETRISGISVDLLSNAFAMKSACPNLGSRFSKQLDLIAEYIGNAQLPDSVSNLTEKIATFRDFASRQGCEQAVDVAEVTSAALGQQCSNDSGCADYVSTIRNREDQRRREQEQQAARSVAMQREADLTEYPYEVQISCHIGQTPLPLIGCTDGGAIRIRNGNSGQTYDEQALMQAGQAVQAKLRRSFEVSARTNGESSLVVKVVVSDRNGKVLFSDTATGYATVRITN